MSNPLGPKADELLRLLLDQAKDHALLLLDAQGTIIGWLAGAEHIFGYTPEEMVGQPVTRIFTPEDVERGLAQHELEVARNNGRAEDDRWLVRKDGSRFWASGVVVPLRDAGGRVVGFGKVLRERTEVKAQIESLESRAETLARADRHKDLFLGTLAHELRNPLAPLVNALQLIRLAGPVSEGLAYPIKLIERQVEFIRRLVDDLLDITRIGAGKVELKLGPVQLQEVLKRAADACRPKAEERRQDFRVLLPPAPITREADADRLHQVVVNLLTNAVKYTPEGGRVWRKATVEGDEVVVRVEDNGVGIDAQMLPRIFDLFTQEEPSRSRSESGLGLWLPEVMLHGGTVQIRSEFTVRLPLSDKGSLLTRAIRSMQSSIPRSLTRTKTNEAGPPRQLVVVVRLMLLELRHRPGLQQPLQDEARSEQRIDHAPEGPAVGGHLHGWAEAPPRVLHAFDGEVVATEVVPEENVGRVLHREDQVAGPAEQPEELAEGGVPVADVVQREGGQHEVEGLRRQEVERPAQVGLHHGSPPTQPPAGQLDHARADVEPHHFGTPVREQFGVCPRAAAGVEDPFARDLGQQQEDRRAVVEGVVGLGVDESRVGVGQLGERLQGDGLFGHGLPPKLDRRFANCPGQQPESSPCRPGPQGPRPKSGKHSPDGASRAPKHLEAQPPAVQGPAPECPTG
jgi:PAS domain S-box-containing protein